MALRQGWMLSTAATAEKNTSTAQQHVHAQVDLPIEEFFFRLEPAVELLLQQVSVGGLDCVAVCCSVLQCVAVCCSVLQCVAVYGLWLLYVVFVAVRHSSLLQCVAVCCCALQCVAVCCSVLQCVAVFCSVLQCVAVCCIMLHCVARYCSMFKCVEIFFRLDPAVELLLQQVSAGGLN